MTKASTLNDQAPAIQCRCSNSAAGNNRLVKWTTAGGLFAALGVCAACCLLPFVLVSLGVAGAWVGTLDSLARYKWPFISMAALLLGYGFYVVYWRPHDNVLPAQPAPHVRPRARFEWVFGLRPSW